MPHSPLPNEPSALILRVLEGSLGGNLIPLFAPIRQNEALFEKIQAEFSKVLTSGHYILGKDVGEFEKGLANTLGYRFAVGCSSGTEALILSLKSLNLPENAEVITPAYSFVASASAILWAGHVPLLADICPETGCLTVETVKKLRTPNTRAVVAVDLFGRQADIDGLREYCQKQKLHLIEDGAQSIGVPNKGATLYTMSFYPTKNMGAVGDAGAILTDDEALATKLRRLTQHGALARDQYDEIGTNARLDTLQAALLKLKLPYVHEWSQARREIAQYYLSELKEVEARGDLQLPKDSPQPEEHVWSLFTVRIPERRNVIMERLQAKGIGCGVYYLKSLNQQVVMEPYLRNQTFPEADRLCEEALSIPIFPELSPREREKVVSTLVECLNTN